MRITEKENAAMQIKLNDEIQSVADNVDLQSFLAQYCTQQLGLAVAVNEQVIARSNWATTRLNQQDDVTVFHAIAGG